MPFPRPARALGLPALAALLTLAPPLAATALAAETPRRLDVQAEAELAVVPDRATLEARLWEQTPAVAEGSERDTDAEALRQARQRLEERAAALIRRLEAEGIASKAITAGSLQVQPQRLPGMQRDDAPSTPRVRTRLQRPVSIEIEDLARLPGLLDALTEAGVNALDGVRYDLADREAATDEALVKALAKARHKAELMAETLAIELGEVIAVSETRAPVFQPRMMAMSDARPEGAGHAEYRPGTITIEAGVNVSWAIAEAP
ncbi:oxidative stress defense protein [Halomonas sp. THAF5a]|uniref:SIMPL domain-containing protein n=1 Tax=Halomonas sp. THAF5a TaxID=2587844 RepID=UPI001267B10C|nr:SIMPL domain-containing protein [Halomonas sp. THAF5a]QFU02449.1 oxidative stress defense protein [Halomonas sp. THAF5a]